MIQSHVIEVDGVFVGAAIRLDTGYRFVATDFRLEQLNSTIWPSLADVQRLARGLYFNGGFGGRDTVQAPAPTRPGAGEGH